MGSGLDQSHEWSILSRGAKDALESGNFVHAEKLYRELLDKVPSTDEYVPMLKNGLCEALSQQGQWDKADQLDSDLLKIIKANTSGWEHVADFFVPRRELRGTLLFQQAKGDLGALQHSERVLREAHEVSKMVNGGTGTSTVAISNRLKSVHAWVQKAEESKLKRSRKLARLAELSGSSGDRGRKEERLEQTPKSKDIQKDKDKDKDTDSVPSSIEQKQNGEGKSIVAKAKNEQVVGPTSSYDALQLPSQPLKAGQNSVFRDSGPNDEKRGQLNQRSRSKNGSLSGDPSSVELEPLRDKNSDHAEQQRRLKSRDIAPMTSKPDRAKSMNGTPTRQSGESLEQKDQPKSGPLAALVPRDDHDIPRKDTRASSMPSPQNLAPSILSPPTGPQKTVRSSPTPHRNSSPILPLIALEPPKRDRSPTKGLSTPPVVRSRNDTGNHLSPSLDSNTTLKLLSPGVEDAIVSNERATISAKQQPLPDQPLLQLTLPKTYDSQLTIRDDKSQSYLLPSNDIASTGSQGTTSLSRSKSVDLGQKSKLTLKSKSALDLPTEGTPEAEQKKRTRSLSTQGRNVDNLQPPQGDADHINFDARVESTITPEQERRANLWFNDIQKVDDFMSQRRNKRDKAVKVAILDTGFRMNHANPEVQAVWEKIARSGKVRSWVDMSNRKNVEDLNGHGTHCAMTFSTIAPAAELHIGQVCIHGSDVQQESVAKAIEHCVKKWKVDIITMSFGFDTMNIRDSLKEAINMACAGNVLMFAAAGNGGRGRRLAYPARHEKVFCVFAADALGGSSGFNPDPFWNDYRFCTLGEHVRMPRTGVDSVILSGTSVATPVAAAFAALVLEFTIQDPVPGQFPIQNAEKLRTKQGMSMVFLEMQHSNRAKMRDSHWHHLEPWNFLTVREGDADELERRRISVPFYINEALKEVD